jgi:hypothetical protein
VLKHAVIAAGLFTGFLPNVTMPAAQVAPARVLVMPFAVLGSATAPGSEASAARWLGEAAAILLADELAATGIGAWAREDRVDVFDRLQLPMTSELTRATMIRVGELVGASEIVFGEVQMGNGLAVRARTIKLDTGKQLPDVTASAPFNDLFTLFSRVASGVGRHTGRRAAPSAAREGSMALPAFENYVKGLMAATPAARQRFLEAAMSQAPHDGRVLTALWSVRCRQAHPSNGAPDSMSRSHSSS